MTGARSLLKHPHSTDLTSFYGTVGVRSAAPRSWTFLRRAKNFLVAEDINIQSQDQCMFLKFTSDNYSAKDERKPQRYRQIWPALLG